MALGALPGKGGARVTNTRKNIIHKKKRFVHTLSTDTLGFVLTTFFL